MDFEAIYADYEYKMNLTFNDLMDFLFSKNPNKGTESKYFT